MGRKPHEVGERGGHQSSAGPSQAAKAPLGGREPHEVGERGGHIKWPAEAIWEAVVPLLPGFTVEVLPQVDSTNSELMRRARDGLTEPVLLVAEAQTAGRGRLGRSWASQPGDSLTFSLGLPLAPVDWSGLSLAVGVSVAQSLHPQLQLKWPNDVWLQDRKLGGILIETATTTATAPGPAGPLRHVGNHGPPGDRAARDLFARTLRAAERAETGADGGAERPADRDDRPAGRRLRAPSGPDRH